MVNTDPRAALQTRPKSVALVALGPSFYDFCRDAFGRQGHKQSFDEIWTVNRGAFAFRHDKVFLMDDLRWVEQHDADYAARIKRHDKPVITCYEYPDYPNAVAYPLEAVIKALGDDLINNTVAYAVAYAMVTQVKMLTLYGADFYYPDTQAREEGGQATAYLLGQAGRFGMQFSLPQSTSLLCANHTKVDAETGRPFRPLYGYHRRSQIKTMPDHPAVAAIKAMQEQEPVNVPGVDPSPRVQADSGNEAGPPRVDQSLFAALPGGRAAPVHPAGNGVFGGQPADQEGRPPGLVSRGIVQGPGSETPGGGVENGEYAAEKHGDQFASGIIKSPEKGPPA